MLFRELIIANIRRGWRIKLNILLELLGSQRGLKAKEIAERLQKDITRYSYIYEHLNSLIEMGLVEKSESLYKVTDKALKVLLDPFEVYWAGYGSAMDVLYELFGPYNALQSAGVFWRDCRFRVEELLSNRGFFSKLFVDSGAQQFYKKFKGFNYPYSVRDYVDFALKVGADHIATLDLPLDILVPRGLDVGEGIKRTVELGVEVVSTAERLGCLDKVVPVLQGYDDPSQWLECLDLYREHGVTASKFSYWSVGSLCMARSVKLVEKVIGEIRRELRENKLHVFGLSLNALRKVYMEIDSFDTSAWVYWAKTDGAILVWDPIEESFVHLQTRDGKRYETKRLMRINAIQLHQMIEYLSMKRFIENCRRKVMNKE